VAFLVGDNPRFYDLVHAVIVAFGYTDGFGRLRWAVRVRVN
jgi:hypothetical protein